MAFKRFLSHGLLAAGLSLLALSVNAKLNDTDSSQAANSAQWRFDVWLDSKKIGTHQMRREPTATGFNIEIDARFKVTLLGIPVYRYRHSNAEQWTNNCLTSIQSETKDGGDKSFIQSSPSDSGSGLKLTTQSGEKTLEGCIRSFAYWDLPLLRAPFLLNSQNADYDAAELTALGRKQVPFNGLQREVISYELRASDKTIELWYSADQDWLGLQTSVDGERVLTYLRNDGESK